ncbi:8827_t:CDS:2 [Acaulospora morrowiae]|uniref:8827_t:CDS:1 n=1 Tax=Acaulospora morrowiae TaxID=94023 RepID=A0A9N8VRQ7_9GLOM|nr:8827_t:CDS:2 [Acaulospora morrowiae]
MIFSFSRLDLYPGHIKLILLIGIYSFLGLSNFCVDASEYDFTAVTFDRRPLEIDRTDVPKQIIIGSSLGGSSHVRPMLEIGKILTERGYNVSGQVTLVAPGNILPSKEYPSISQISTGPTIDYIEEPIYQQIFNLRKLFVQNYISHFNVYKHVIETLNPDVFICDVLMNDVCLDVAWINNRPVVGFGEGLLASTFTSYRSEVLYKCHVNMENESFLNRFRCAIIEPVRFAFGMWSINEDLNNIRAQTGVDTVINTYEIIKSSLFLANTFFGFEVPHPMSPLVQEIGPVMQDEYPILTPNLLSFVSTHKKILYVSFSEELYTSLENNVILLQTCAEAIQQKIIDGVIWSFINPSFDEILLKTITLSDGTSLSTTEILSNQHPDILVSRFTSQFSVLNHTNVKVFLSSGGYMSSYEALYTGTPMLVMPIEFRDLNNAEKLERLGVGLTINRLNLDAKDILSKIKLLLADQSIQNNLKKTKVLTRVNSKRKYRAADLIEFVMHALTLNPNDSLDVDGGEIGGGRNYDGLLKEWTAPEMRMGFFRGKYFDIYISFLGGITIVTFVIMRFFLKCCC